ncbi:MAG: helix-turn-helix transcriptional regulator [Nitrospirae bacterium]|nr:helix-turn-helix transcriptional regulator [Nitrospirota bacterium]
MAQEPSINVFSVLILIGAVQGFLLAGALLFMRRGNRLANLYLAALFLAMSVLLIDGFFHVTNYDGPYRYLLGLSWPVNFLPGPFLYFYVRELSSPSRRVFPRIQLLHFLPMTASALIISYYFIAYGHAPEWAVSCCTVIEGTQFNIRDIALIPVAIQKITYWTLSLLLVMAYSARIKQSFSSIDKINLSWLRTLIFLFYALVFIFIFFIFFSAKLGIQREIVPLLYLSCAMITSVMAFKGLLHPEILLQIEIANRAELMRTGQNSDLDAPFPTPDILQNAIGMLQKEKYQKSYLAPERAAEIARKLLQLMDREKLYLRPELTLSELADKLSVSANDLSQVINREMKKSFFDFINEYRVQEAKKLLSSPKYNHLSVLGIALDAGFNSKSAFYNAFNKYIGTTPSVFKKQCEFAEHDKALNVQGRA